MAFFANLCLKVANRISVGLIPRDTNLLMADSLSILYHTTWRKKKWHPKANLTIAWLLGEVQASPKVSSEQSNMLSLSHYRILKVLYYAEFSNNQLSNACL